MQEISYSSTAIREALNSVEASNIADQHKRVLVALALQVLRNLGSIAVGDVIRNAHESWLPHEVQTLTAYLEGKLAINWQHADELVMWLVTSLRRGPDDIRKKAVELGFGVGVDYRMAKSQVPRAEA